MEAEIYYMMALNLIEGFGNGIKKEMIRICGSAKNVFENQELWRRKIKKKSLQRVKISITDNIRKVVDKEIQILEKQNIKVCSYFDSDYPGRMKRCVDSPLLFYYKGSSNFNYDRILAIVGTRNASNYGTKAVCNILYELKSSNIATISGLAYGIDTIAHDESVNLGLPTMAVLGCGLRTIYPSVNKNLANRILDSGGAIISEFPYDTMPDRVNFPKRNRIIAGMADAVLVAETGLKGGSIITAHIAHSYNRDIFAIPGSIFDESSAGCNTLIKNNIAALVSSGFDILNMMNWDSGKKFVQRELFVELSDNEEKIFNFLGSESKSIDQISENFQDMSPSKIAGLLLSLELKGVIEAHPGKMYVRRGN